MKAVCYSCSTWNFLCCRALDWVWRGVAFSALGPTRYREVDLPDRLPPGWARVRVRQCGLCASDIHIMRAKFDPRISPGAMLSEATEPVVLGHELVGTVTAVAGDTPLAPGQRVISRSGSYRNCFNLGEAPCRQCAAGEYALCDRQGARAPAHEPIRGGGYAPHYHEAACNLLPVPDGLSDDEAMLAEPLACGLRAVLRLTPDGADRVLVLGAGMQGLGVVHWLKRLMPSAEVTCLARHRFQAQLCRALGADRVLASDARAASVAQCLQTKVARGVLGNELLLHGFDAVIDTVGNPRTIEQSLRWTAPGGQVLVVGVHLWRGRLDYSPLWFRNVRIGGVFAHGMECYEGRKAPTLALTMDLLTAQARLPVGLVTGHMALADYRQAVRMMETKSRSQAVRIALMPE